MSAMQCRSTLAFVLLVVTSMCAVARGGDAGSAELEQRFAGLVRPFLEQYCVACHSGSEPEEGLDLGGYGSVAEASRDSDRWTAIIEKLETGQMPPGDSDPQPTDDARRAVKEWFLAARYREGQRNAGDPGVVLLRRLSNAEYNYTIRDLTGVDIRPAREFPVDPANSAGFDNSGESLVMSPSLLRKYLEAAHEVASHLLLKPDGFGFAPHPMLAETDRDQYCVQRIIEFYHAHNTNYADYFAAAWRFKHRDVLGRSAATLSEFAADRKISPKYLETIWRTLADPSDDVGPLVKLQAMWRELPVPVDDDEELARAGCEQMSEYVVQLRKKVEPRFLNITAGQVNNSSQPLLIWKNVQYATHRMTFDPAQLQVEGEDSSVIHNEPEPGIENEFGPGRTLLIENVPGDPDLVVPAGQRARYEAAFARFCRVFPDRFYTQERGRNYFDTTKDRGRFLSAGFHSLMGYFRDDQPLYELILSDGEREELDAMWRDLDFIASASERTYVQFCSSGQRGERSILQTEHATEVSAEDNAVTSEARITQLKQSYLARAEGGDPRGLEAIRYYFDGMNERIRWTEKARLDAEPSHLASLLQFASRAFRRPLSNDEQNELLDDYHSSRKAGLDHQSAMREGIVRILMSPDMCYRIELASSTGGVHPVSDYELASRLSYFLWSSIPDELLLAHAAAGDLHEAPVLTAEARRMLRDPRVRAFATEFGGSWLDFRRFDEISTVDRERFPEFTDALRTAMYEEPIRFLVDAFQSDRSLLDLLYGDYTFVNPVLARHYRMPIPDVGPDEWVRIDDAAAYGRGGLLPMAAFMTKNSPGLRTSPVKRGNWVVKNILGERIPAPPPNVPELPQDEAKLDLPLRDMLSRHRADTHCAACHARFDSFGLVFEGFGPIGERREIDLAGRSIDASATFPTGVEGQGLAGLQEYIRECRQQDFIDNLSRKLLAYALGRSLILSDEPLIRQIDERLAGNGYRLNILIECIVTSPQFLNKRCQVPPESR